MSSFIFSPAARLDLLEIWDYIAEDNVTAADKVTHTIHQQCKLLCQRPYIGHQRIDLTNRPVLFWSVFNYLIIYKKKSNPLEIARILIGYRNIIELLE